MLKLPLWVQPLHRLVWLGLSGMLLWTPLAPAAATLTPLELGKRIYTEGLRADGTPLTGAQNMVHVEGQDAACVRCHRNSGMGSVEGEERISPISGRYLFPADNDQPMAEQDGHVGKTVSKRHVPYTLEAIDQVMRSGVNNQGRSLSSLMPRYELNQDELRGLQAYLSTLSVGYSTGAEAHLIHFATVITPDVAPERRKVFRDMLEAAVRSKNASTAPQRRYMANAAMMVTRSDRRWALDVWELTGAPETWAAQLDALYARTPPFALISGLSGTEWAPVHQFCDRHAVPCWFPSVPNPPEADAHSYNLYFRRGVTLESEVLAAILAENAGKGQVVIEQVATEQAVSRAAAQALRAALARRGLKLVDHLVPKADPAGVALALQGAAKKKRPVMLWLQDAELRGITTAGDTPVYLSSALLQGGPAAVPAPLHAQARLIYPFALPAERQANLAYLQTWLKLQQIPLLDEVMQSEVFFAVNFMTDVVGDMLDNLYRDYLVERAEDMLSKRENGKAEQETRDRQSLGRNARYAVDQTARTSMTAERTPDMFAASQVVFAYKDSKGTTVYPHLSLGLRQRFASKGAAVVSFANDGTDTLVLQHPWVIP